MSDTPRTDSMIPYGPPYNGEESGLIHVPKAFARQLEREMNQWKACAELLAKHVQGVSDQDCKALAVFEKLKGVKP